MDTVSEKNVPVDVEADVSPEKEVIHIIEETRDAAEHDTQIGVIEAAKMYPKAMFWAVFISLAVIMAGYDGQIITSFYAVEAFEKKYGVLYDGSWEITAPWQVGLGMGNPIGQIIGPLAAGWPMERWGRKKVLYFCNVMVIGTIFIQFFSPNLGVLCLGEVLAGVTWGIFVTVSPTYASEVSPTALRGILTAFTNLAFVIGQFIAQGVTAGLEGRPDKWAYKAPFALQWLWPVLMLMGLYFAPESPWWLVRRGRLEDAKASLKALAWNKGGLDLETSLNIIEQTDRLEKAYQTESSWMDCFRGPNRRRTEISMMAYAIQVICGNSLIGYCNYFFELAGLADSEAFNMGVGNTAIGFVGTCSSWVLLSYFGRRTIYNSGLLFMTMVLFIIAIIDCAPSYSTNPGFAWAQASLLDIWTFVYQLTVGPLCFVIISEVSSTKLRSRSIALATAAQSVCSVIATVIVPYMFNPQNGDFRGKIGFFFGGLSLLCCVWCHFRLPETAHRTFEEIDIMFERRLPTKEFKGYDVFANSS